MAIRSITFTGTNKEDYLVKPHMKQILRKGKTYEEYEAACQMSSSERYKKYGHDLYGYFFYERKSGLENDIANKCLINRTIEFSTDKINVIFGPNASGKSTILKAIAGHALCGNSSNFDGYTNIMHNAFELSSSFLTNDYTVNMVNDLIYKNVKNTCIVNWDGNPVYYHNFENRKKTGSVDDFEGSIFGNIAHALLFTTYKSQMNSGKSAYYIFEQIFNIANTNLSVNDLITECDNTMLRANDTYKKVYSVQKEYLLSKYDASVPHQNTILLDEIEKNLDIPNTISMFTDVLPALQKINDHQIIVVSHSPFILSETICNPDKYNIISMDKKYTNDVKALLSKLKF